MTDTEIILLADDFKSTSMACGAMVEDFDAIGFARAIEQASRRAALEETIQIIETHRVPIGNSAAGEMAAGWTMDALHEIRDAIRQLAEGGKQ